MRHRRRRRRRTAASSRSGSRVPRTPSQTPQMSASTASRSTASRAALDRAGVRSTGRSLRRRHSPGSNTARYMLAPWPLDPKRTVAELQELRELTGDENGAQRVAWTETWATARRVAARQARGRPARDEEIDEAGNQWFTLRGASERALLIGGHIDSVPNGGWLDGCLNVMAGVEVLRRIAGGGHAAAHRAARQLGRRGGRALRPLALRLLGRRRVDGRPGRAAPAHRRETASRCPTRCASTASTSTARSRRGSQLESAAAYLELHIEQGPGARVDGPPARRRARHVRRRAPPDHLARPGGARGLDADGQAPRRARRRGEARARDPADRRGGRRRGGVHVGRRRLQAGHRHVGRRDRGAAARPAAPGRRNRSRALLDARARTRASASPRRRTSRSSGSGSGRSSRSSSTRRSSSSPTSRSARCAGTSHRLPSGPLHDAAEVARAGVPTVMLFVQIAARALAHEARGHEARSIWSCRSQALDRLASKTLDRLLGMSTLFGERARPPLPRDRRRGGLHLARGLDDPAPDDDGPEERATRRRRR